MSSGPDSTLDSSQVIRIFRKTKEPVLTASEVSEELPVGERTVQKYLKALSDEGKLYRKDVGVSAAVWWLNEDALTMSDLPGVELSSGKTVRTIHHWPLQLSLTESSVLSSLNIPGDRAQVPKRRNAVLKAYVVLREQGEVSKREFIELLYPEHQAGYSNSNSWWERLIRENIKHFPAVSKASRGGVWSFNNDHVSVTDLSYTREEFQIDKSVPTLIPEKVDRPPRTQELVFLVLGEWEPDYGNPDVDSRAYRTGKRAVLWLTRVGTATKKEFIDELFVAETPEGEQSWWRNGQLWWKLAVAPALQTATEYGYVEQDLRGYTSRFPTRI